MKRFYTLLVILTLFSSWIHSATASDEADWMPDANLRTAVRSALNLNNNDALTQAGMANLTGLTARNAQISSLTGLEHATNLQKLDLRDNTISNISALSGLTNLESLKLKGNNISSVSALSGLTNLTLLNLKENNISSISTLSGLTNLEHLRVDVNSITDVQPLTSLVNLERLWIAGNSLTNAHLLSSLTGLTQIDIPIPDPPDTTAPSVTVSVPSGTQNGTFDATITFTESVSNFVQSDVSLSGSAASITSWRANSGNTVYTATITPTASGTVTIGVAANVATDAANNQNTAATSKSVTVSVDTTAPGVTVSVPSGIQNGQFSVSITFTESISNLWRLPLELGTNTAGATINSEHVMRTNGGTTSVIQYVTPTRSGEVMLRVPAGIATDAEGNANTASEVQTVSVDVDAPGVSITVPSDVQNGAFNATITFTESVSNFVQSDVSLSGSAASITGWRANSSNTVYTATITPTTSGTVTIGVAANVATDAANNANTAATSKTVSIDVDKPTVTVGVPSGTQTGAFNATITFSETVSGFTQSDVSLTGSAASITGWRANSGNTVYTATITPTTSGTVTIGVAANVATDAANNQNTAATSKTVTVSVDTTAPGVTVSVPSGTQNGAFSVTITFTESVSGFTQSDVSLSGSAASITGWRANSDNTVYTATITPTASGTVTIGVAANVATDAANNQNTAATSKSVTVSVDTTAPGVTVSVPSGVQNSRFSVTITFTEAVSDFVQSEVSLRGSAASITAWRANSDNTVYTATITPTASGTVTIGVAANVATDAANNANTAATSKTVSIDVDKPTVTIGVPSGTQTGAFNATITFSETVSGFTQSDVSLTGSAASITGWRANSDKTVYTATITPTASGTVTIGVAANVATDAANNANTAATSKTVSIDVDKPTVTIGVPSGTQTGAFNATITFSETVSGFTQSDVSLTGSAASITGWRANSDNTVYTATITPTASATVTIGVAANVATDAANNQNTAATSKSVTVSVDTTAPGVTVSVPSGTQTSAFNATITFTESVSGFTQSDVSLTGSAASITGWRANSDNTVYTATITPTASGTVTVSVDANVATDAASNQNTAATSKSVTVSVDTTAPGVTVSVPSGTQTSAFNATITFTESVSNFVQSDVSLSGSAASITGWRANSGNTVYTATITPTASGTVTIGVAANVATDAANNQNTAATSKTVTVSVDTTSPGVTVSVPSGTQNGAFSVTIMFTESVSNFVQSDVSLSGSAASITSWRANSGNTVYTATITPTASGTVTIGVAANVATDAANNSNTAATSKTVTVDVDRPTVTIGVPSGTQTSAFNATITFTESVSNFVQSDVSLSGSAASITGWRANSSSTVYTATITPTASGTVTIGVAANVATDAANNQNTAATSKSVTVSVDTTAPGVTVSVPSGVQNGAFNATITFTESVSGFTQSEVSLRGSAASITSWRANSDDTVYTVTITPTTSGTVTIDVAAGVATDAANNQNTAATSKSVTVSVDTTAPGVTVSVPSGIQNGQFSVSITFTESISNLWRLPLELGTNTAGATINSEHVMRTNGGTTSVIQYVTPTRSGEVMLRVPAGIATDAEGNANTASEVQTVSVDVDAPGVSITVPSDVQNGAFNATITFTESVSNFVQSDVSLSGSAASITGWRANSSNTVYTATITPTTSGTVTIGVAANVATDAANNANTAATSKTVSIDVDKPTVTVGVPSGTQTGAFNATITFSETVSGFTQSDVSLTGSAASITGWRANSDNTVYTATITPTASATVTIGVAANVATDAANNQNTAATSKTVTVSVDTTAPGVTVSVPSGTQNGAFSVTITFTESVSGFTQSDVSLTGSAASITGWRANSGNTVYIATITPTASGTVTIGVAANVATDAANNQNTAATSKSVTVSVDTTAPGVTVSVPSGTQTSAFNATITFTESVSNFVQSDVSLSGSAASITGWRANSSNTVYTATITPTASGTVTIGVAANVATDAANNQNTAATSKSVTVSVDTTAPGVTVSVPSGVQNSRFSVTSTFTEAVSDFVQSEVSLRGSAASITAWRANSDNTVYTATITPTASGTVTIDVAAGVATDAANNANTAATSKTVSIDVDRPTVTIGVPSGTQTGAFNATITFSETVSGFTQSDVSLTGSTASITAWSANNDNTTYTATITPATSGQVSLSVAAGVATDAANNPNTASGTQTVTVLVTLLNADTDPPEVSISVPSDVQNGGFYATITFTEPVSGFEKSELSLSGTATASTRWLEAWDDGTTYTAWILPTTNGTVTINVAQGVATDAASNPNTAATAQTVTVNFDQLTVYISKPSDDTRNDLFSVHLVFSHRVSDFGKADVTLSGTATASVVALNWSRRQYWVDILPTTNGTLTVSVPAGVATNSAGYKNTASNSISFTIEQLVEQPEMESSTVTWMPDGPLVDEVVSALDLADASTLTQAKMAELTTLTAKDAEIVSLTGLEHATNLTSLNLENNYIMDIRPIKGLANLTYLNLSHNLLRHTLPATGLIIEAGTWSNLQELDLSHNDIVCASNNLFAGRANSENTNLLPSLTRLDVSDNSDLSGLHALFFWFPTYGSGIRYLNLTHLDIRNTAFTDLHQILYDFDDRSDNRGAWAKVSATNRLEWLRANGTRISDMYKLRHIHKGGWGSSYPILIDVIDIDIAVPLGSSHNYQLKRPGQPNWLIDPNLFDAISEELELGEDETLTKEMMLRLTELDASDRGVESTIGLNYATNLTSLDISGPLSSGRDRSTLMLRDIRYRPLETLKISLAPEILSARDLYDRDYSSARPYIGGYGFSSLKNLDISTTEIDVSWLLAFSQLETLKIGSSATLINAETLNYHATLESEDINVAIPAHDDNIAPQVSNFSVSVLPEQHSGGLLMADSYTGHRYERSIRCEIEFDEMIFNSRGRFLSGSIDPLIYETINTAAPLYMIDSGTGRSSAILIIKFDSKNISWNREYTMTFQVPNGAITDLAGNAFSGVNCTFTFRASGGSSNINYEVVSHNYSIIEEEGGSAPKVVETPPPIETSLLTNYPNPFNPETWIPYQLANDTNVQISIYDINGALVRQLDLGHQRAGYYTNRSRAAYWDGRNEFGEQVATGIYFYQLQAGSESFLRKMVILK